LGACREHDIILEKIIPRKKGQHYPQCTHGKNVPTEDPAEDEEFFTDDFDLEAIEFTDPDKKLINYKSYMTTK